MDTLPTVQDEIHAAWDSYVAANGTPPSQNTFESLLKARVSRDHAREAYKTLSSPPSPEGAPMSETETEIVINTAPALAQRVSTPALDQVARLARLEALTRAMGHELDAMRQRLANMETVASADHATVGTVRELLDLLTTDEDAWNVLVQICRAGSMRNDSGALLNFVRRTTGRPVVKPAALA